MSKTGEQDRGLMMQNTFDETFTNLIRAWSHHQDLKTRHAHPAELYASRRTLDRMRFEAAQRRRAIAGG